MKRSLLLKWTWSSQQNEQPERLKKNLKKIGLDRAILVSYVPRERASGFIEVGGQRHFLVSSQTVPPLPKYIWCSSKMAARNAKSLISTVLRWNKEQWTVWFLTDWISRGLFALLMHAVMSCYCSMSCLRLHCLAIRANKNTCHHSQWTKTCKTSPRSVNYSEENKKGLTPGESTSFPGPFSYPSLSRSLRWDG